MLMTFLSCYKSDSGKKLNAVYFWLFTRFVGYSSELVNNCAPSTFFNVSLRVHVFAEVFKGRFLTISCIYGISTSAAPPSF